MPKIYREIVVNFKTPFNEFFHFLGRKILKQNKFHQFNPFIFPFRDLQNKIKKPIFIFNFKLFMSNIGWSLSIYPPPPTPGDNQMLSSIKATIVEVFMEFNGDSQNWRNKDQQLPEIPHV
jgi:hypothetical protein